MTIFAAAALTCFFETPDAQAKPKTPAAAEAAKPTGPGWDLSDIYADAAAWDAAYAKTKTDAENLAKF